MLDRVDNEVADNTFNAALINLCASSHRSHDLNRDTLALREIGIVLFLAVVGIKAGGHFFHTLLSQDGVSWLGYGAIITIVPLLVVGMLARGVGKMNYLTLCGLLSGAMTDPPALAFANGIKEDSGAPALAYATVYPLVMFMRIILPQLLAVLLWAGS